MGRNQTQSPERKTSLLLIEFLEVAITSIIFLKGIYPTGAFERRRYMNLVVHRARHPQVYSYIHDSLNALVGYLEQGMVETVAVMFFNNNNNNRVVSEKFVFKINVKRFNGVMVEEDEELQGSMRLFLVKLYQSECLSKSLSKDLRWEITAYFCSLPTDTKDMWIPTHTMQWQQPPLITPIKSINTEPLSVQLYLEHPSLSEPM